VVSVLLLGACTSAPNAATVRAARHGQWQRVFFDHFRHGVSPRRWVRYTGQPGGDPGGYWSPSHVFASGGILHLATYRDARFGGRWVSGGLSSRRALRQRYGKYEVRLRVAAGKGIAFAALLWPMNERWPPEIDFAENGGGTARRNLMTATLHWGRTNHEIQDTVHGDFTRWHTLGVEWLPGSLRYTIDGRVWAQVNGSQVPAQRMVLDLQTQAGTCGDRFNPCPDATTPSLVEAQIAWVQAWRWTGG
jgi:beta-glucanase (GH16 family)